MRVLIRDDVNGLYWVQYGHWVKNSADAWDFKSLEAAGQTARQQRSDRISVVLSYEDPVCELAVHPDFCV
jgi:hypothetical protein